jgi:hypothetical protein
MTLLLINFVIIDVFYFVKIYGKLLLSSIYILRIVFYFLINPLFFL